MKHALGFKMLASAVLLLSIVSNPVLARDSHGSKDKHEALFPNATRVAPKLDLTSAKDQKSINEGLDAVAAGDKAKALQLLQPIADGGSRSKYAQALALQGLATLKYKDGDFKGAIDLLQKSLAIGVMPNDTYFQLEYELAQFQVGDKQYQASLDTLSKWRAEGKKETADSYGLEGLSDYRLGKYAEAIAAITKAKSLTDKPEQNWNQILMASYSESGQTDKAAQLAQELYAANPDDPDALNNAITILTQAQKYPEAIKLMETARAKGDLKTEAGYMNLATLYFNKGLSSDHPGPDAGKCVAVLQDGMSKGVVSAGLDTYLLLGKAEVLADHTDQAIQAYNKALPLDTNGEAALQLANLLLNNGKYSQAKHMIQQSISKGVKRKGTAYLVLAQCEQGLKNKAGEIAALKVAAQDPETAERAKSSLKKLASRK